MINTGYLQATIAYKSAKPGGQALDINGELVSVSGRKRAVLLYVGTENPNPTLYEVEGYFTKKQLLSGNPSQKLSPDVCDAEIIYTNPNYLVMQTGLNDYEILLYSSGPWELISNPPIAAINIASGPAGFNYIKLSSNLDEGQGYFIFRSGGSEARIYVVSANDLDAWVLDTGNWDNLGFWQNNGIWNY